MTAAHQSQGIGLDEPPGKTVVKSLWIGLGRGAAEHWANAVTRLSGQTLCSVLDTPEGQAAWEKVKRDFGGEVIKQMTTDSPHPSPIFEAHLHASRVRKAMQEEIEEMLRQ